MKNLLLIILAISIFAELNAQNQMAVGNNISLVGASVAYGLTLAPIK